MAREARLMRVEGLVQGVGFRPTVWRIAAALNLAGEVFNDPEGVGIFLEGDPREASARPDRLDRREARSRSRGREIRDHAVPRRRGRHHDDHP